MTGEREQLLDEVILRRALRLEADERAPLFDPIAIAAAARGRPRLAVVSALVGITISALGAVVVWSAVAFLLPAVAAGAFDTSLELVALLAVSVSRIADLAQQPAVPLSLLAALVITIAHELRQGRELSHARAS